MYDIAASQLRNLGLNIPVLSAYGALKGFEENPIVGFRPEVISDPRDRINDIMDIIYGLTAHEQGGGPRAVDADSNWNIRRAADPSFLLAAEQKLQYLEAQGESNFLSNGLSLSAVRAIGNEIRELFKDGMKPPNDELEERIARAEDNANLANVEARLSRFENPPSYFTTAEVAERVQVITEQLTAIRPINLPNTRRTEILKRLEAAVVCASRHPFHLPKTSSAQAVPAPAAPIVVDAVPVAIEAAPFAIATPEIKTEYPEFDALWMQVHAECAIRKARAIMALGANPDPLDQTLIELRSALDAAAVLYAPALKTAVDDEEDKLAALILDGGGSTLDAFQQASGRFGQPFSMEEASRYSPGKYTEAVEKSRFQHALVFDDFFISGSCTSLYSYVGQIKVIEECGGEFDVAFPVAAQPLKFVAEEVLRAAEAFAAARHHELINPPLLTKVEDTVGKTGWKENVGRSRYGRGTDERYRYIAEQIARKMPVRDRIIVSVNYGIKNLPGIPEHCSFGQRPVTGAVYNPADWDGQVCKPNSPGWRGHIEAALARLAK